ncbi:MAG: hypothetical protein RIQ53_3717 [Pseudomonadota bacterium]|jgi:signal transduction histidine kinase
MADVTAPRPCDPPRVTPRPDGRTGHRGVGHRHPILRGSGAAARRLKGARPRRRGLGLLVLPLVLPLVVPMMAQAGPAGWQTDALWLRQAEFIPDAPTGAAAPASASISTPSSLRVSLPDSWQARAQPRPGSGLYRLHWQLPATASADGTWALWSARMPTHHRIRINGQLVSDTLATADGMRPRVEPLAPRTWPAELLRPGLNTVEIEARYGLQAGLGPLQIGPQPAVQATALRHRRLHTDVPRLLNTVVAGACVFMLLLWAGQREERALGWFGLFGLMLMVRNAAIVDPDAHAPAAWGTWLYLGGIAIVTALGGFAHSVAPRPWRRYPALLTLAAAGCVLHALLHQGDPAAADAARMQGYVALIPVQLMALWFIGSHVRSLPRAQALALILSLLATFIAGQHDREHHQGRQALETTYWLPWVAPWLVLAYGAILARRVGVALRDVRVLNRELEQRVAERTARLAEADAAKARFLAVASHDLRQPLVGIGLMIGLLREQPGTPTQQRLLGRIADSLGAMEALLRSLLDLSRLDSGPRRVRLQTVDLRPLLDALVEQERPAADSRQLRLRWRVPAGARVHSDALLLEQIARNLLANALRYTARGGVLLTVRRRGAHWRLAVWDTGAGIAPERQSEVFDDFVQLAPADTGGPREGLGLGLSIVRRAADLLRSPVRLRSVPGRGSVFWIDLPAAEDRPA